MPTHERFASLLGSKLSANGHSADPDESIISLPMTHQAVEKVKDVFGAGSAPS
jgi:hypothetical protein